MNKVGGEVEIRLEVGWMEEVDNEMGCLVDDVFREIELLGGVGGKGVSRGEVE